MKLKKYVTPRFRIIKHLKGDIWGNYEKKKLRPYVRIEKESKYMFKPFFFVRKIPSMLMSVNASKLIGAGLATIALGGPGIGSGVVFSGLLRSVAQNPILRGVLFGYSILGFALVEAIALFALMMAFTILFAF